MGRILANLRLGTKFLLSMVVVIAGLTWFSLLMVRETVQARTRQELTATVPQFAADPGKTAARAPGCHEPQGRPARHISVSFR